MLYGSDTLVVFYKTSGVTAADFAIDTGATAW